MENIQPYLREGAWSSAHSFHYECAWRFFAEYKSELVTLHEKEAALRDTYKTEDPELLSSLINRDVVTNRK